MAPRKKPKTRLENRAKKWTQRTLKRQKRREDTSKQYTKIKRKIAPMKDEFVKMNLLNDIQKNVMVNTRSESSYTSQSIFRRVANGLLYPFTFLVNLSISKVM